MVNQLIKRELKSALRRMSEKNKVHHEALRLMITKPNGSLGYYILDGSEIISPETIDNILGIGKIDVMNKREVVPNFLSDAIVRLSNENDINVTEANIRIYANNGSFEPKAHLFNGAKAVKEIEIENLID
jgi:hypothetical protein